MIDRFLGQKRRSNTIEALRNQSALFGDAGLAEAICDEAVILGLEPGEKLIEESAPTDDFYFILSGTLSIRVNDREIAFRTSGQHIGEMAVLDPGQRRSASAVAEADAVVARIDAATFNRIADSFPQLWRNIARELSKRLRQRNRYVPRMNPRPVLFLGCSTEALILSVKSNLNLITTRSSSSCGLTASSMLGASTGVPRAGTGTSRLCRSLTFS